MSTQILTPEPGAPVQLRKFNPQFHAGYTKKTARQELESLQEKLQDLQERLYAENKRSLLIILQAMDAGGKDGTIRRVFEGVNPQGVYVANFKAPTEEELARDFLWRIHRHTPRRGYIGIFNRSHYEDVLIVRVNNLVPETVWQQRYEHINNFERLLVVNGTQILKFYLHISKKEQKERFLERLSQPDKHWKFSMGDMPVRERWEDYMRAYEAVLTHCNTDYAPWFIIPGNQKWYRDLVVTRTIVETLEAMNPQYPPPEPDLDKVTIPD